jgi:hypothetical protein
MRENEEHLFSLSSNKENQLSPLSIFSLPFLSDPLAET